MNQQRHQKHARGDDFRQGQLRPDSLLVRLVGLVADFHTMPVSCGEYLHLTEAFIAPGSQFNILLQASCGRDAAGQVTAWLRVGRMRLVIDGRSCVRPYERLVLDGLILDDNRREGDAGRGRHFWWVDDGVG